MINAPDTPPIAVSYVVWTVLASVDPVFRVQPLTATSVDATTTSTTGMEHPLARPPITMDPSHATRDGSVWESRRTTITSTA
jgi:hypothetical protein